MKASDLLVKCLEAEGVERIFGVPGEENADTMISLMDSKIEFVLCRHEQSAAFMADAYGRLTGKSGVCLATLGPGVTNLVTGLADANMDRAPTVAIIGQGSTRRLHKESHQNMDSLSMMRPISKWVTSIVNAESIPEIVRKAFKVAEAEKPGVTVIELPEDIAEDEVNLLPMKVTKTRRPAADHKAIKAAVDLVAAAKNPIIIAGNGAVRKRASDQLKRFAHKSGIAVVSTFMGKGAVARSDEHCLFTMGLQGGDYVNLAVDEADLVIAAGYDLVEYAPSLWNKTPGKKLISLDFEPAEIDSDFPVDVDVVGDLGDALWQMSEELNNRFEGKLPLFDINDRKKLRDTIVADLFAEENNASFPAKPQRIINDVQKFLGPRDIVLSDVGAHKMWISRYFNCEEPNRCLISNGFCTMGIALPGGIGAYYAEPDVRVLAISGDAGFLMNVQELETAVRLKIKMVHMVWVDGEYGLIKWKQQNGFDGKHSDLKFGNPKWEQLAQSFGMWGKEVSSAEGIMPALEEAFSQDGPALLAIPVDYTENRKLTERLGNIVMPI
ncbi:acetolactate synthase large subunit [Alphaproteobacteria bacterium]|nr:acetolactate synthase large subunit [Alphaproteobacteria bacterium]